MLMTVMHHGCLDKELSRPAMLMKTLWMLKSSRQALTNTQAVDASQSCVHVPVIWHQQLLVTVSAYDSTLTTCGSTIPYKDLQPY